MVQARKERNKNRLREMHSVVKNSASGVAIERPYAAKNMAERSLIPFRAERAPNKRNQARVYEGKK